MVLMVGRNASNDRSSTRSHLQPSKKKKKNFLSLALSPLHIALWLPLRPSCPEHEFCSASLLPRAPFGAARLPPSRALLAPYRRALVLVVLASPVTRAARSAKPRPARVAVVRARHWC
jgi:hypothetical protein